MLPGINGSPLERDFSRARGRSRRYKQTCLQVIKFLCSSTCDPLRQYADTPRDSPLTRATARSPGLYSGSESNATAGLSAPFPAKSSFSGILNSSTLAKVIPNLAYANHFFRKGAFMQIQMMKLSEIHPYDVPQSDLHLLE